MKLNEYFALKDFDQKKGQCLIKTILTIVMNKSIKTVPSLFQHLVF